MTKVMAGRTADDHDRSGPSMPMGSPDRLMSLPHDGAGAVRAQELPFRVLGALARTSDRQQRQDHSEDELGGILSDDPVAQTTGHVRLLEDRSEKILGQLVQRRRGAGDRGRVPSDFRSE